MDLADGASGKIMQRRYMSSARTALYGGHTSQRTKSGTIRLVSRALSAMAMPA